MRRRRCHRISMEGTIGMLILAIAALPVYGLIKICCGDEEELVSGILQLVIGIIIWVIVW